jgi:hypothetical protein
LSNRDGRKDTEKEKQRKLYIHAHWTATPLNLMSRSSVYSVDLADRYPERKRPQMPHGIAFPKLWMVGRS